MGKYLEPYRLHMVNMVHVLCMLGKSTDTHLEYVILIAFTLQQWLHKHASMYAHFFKRWMQSLFPRLFFSCYVYSHDNTNFEVLRSHFHINCAYIYICVCVYKIIYSCIQPGDGLLGRNVY
jgi:hypothetical protein